jgi:hypothetical protein
MNQDTQLPDVPSEIELIALAIKSRGVRCRVLKTNEPITFKPRHGLWRQVPGEILTVKSGKIWNFSGTRYISGELVSSQIEISRLNLVPLKLESVGMWYPKDEYWGESADEIDPYCSSIIKAGPRPAFEMEQVIPGEDPEDWDNDPILRASDYQHCGDPESAQKIMEQILTTDLRCLDAHAHLGNWKFNPEPNFDSNIKIAMQHYEVGIRIGELSLGADFKGVLKWGHVNNRPFLRCLHGYGLCFWWLGDHKKAREVFHRMMWLNPTDNQGIRFVLAALDQGQSWQEFTAEEKKERSSRLKALSH